MPAQLSVAVLFAQLLITPSTVYNLEIRNYDDRIVGGSSAHPGQFPYIVSVRLLTGSHFCGGSIIHPSFVLTAAHCTETLQPEDLVIVAGTTQLDGGGTTYNCQRIINHPGYSRQRLTNDISLVSTTSAMQFNDYVQAIPIAKNFGADNSPALISGWGLLKYKGDLSTQLQFLETNVISNDECRARHNILNRRFIYDSVICAYTHPEEGICLGDSGGPLVVQQIQVGIMSWVVPCGAGVPDAYTRVTAHYEWLVAQITAEVVTEGSVPEPEVPIPEENVETPQEEVPMAEEQQPQGNVEDQMNPNIEEQPGVDENQLKFTPIEPPPPHIIVL